MRKYDATENKKIVDNIPYKLRQLHQQGIPNASHKWAPLIKVFTFKNIYKIYLFPLETLPELEVELLLTLPTLDLEELEDEEGGV